MSFLLGSIGSSLLGGLFGSSSKSKDRRIAMAQHTDQMNLARDNMTMQREFAKKSLGWKIDDAKSRGLHPLVGAGGNASMYSPVNAGTVQMPEGSPMADSMAQISSALGSQVGSKMEKRINEKQLELMDAQLAESRSRTLLNASQARRPIYGPPPAVTGITSGLEGMDPGVTGSDRGVRREPTPDMPARQKVSLGGNTAQGPNPEAFEVGLSELIAGALIYGPQWIYGGIKKAETKRRENARGRQPEHQTEGW